MVAVAAGVWVGLMWIVAGAVGGHLLPQQTTSATVTTLPAYPTGAASKRECFCVLFSLQTVSCYPGFFSTFAKKTKTQAQKTQNSRNICPKLKIPTIF